MRTNRFLFLLIIAFVSCSVHAQESGYPVEGENWYFLKMTFKNPISTKESTWKMDSVSVNGTEARDFLLFQNEREVFSNEIDEQNSVRTKGQV
jgi:hypothetical protein